MTWSFPRAPDPLWGPETRPDRMTKTSPNTAPLFLGIDTGGTYTDAVLWSEAGGPASSPRPRR